MKGRVLWDYIEEQARRKLNKGNTWELRVVELLDNEIAKATLRNPMTLDTADCLVVYAKEEGLTTCEL